MSQSKMVHYKIKCPQCGYHYWVEGITYEQERCPQCGHSGWLNEFIVAQQQDVAVPEV